MTRRIATKGKAAAIGAALIAAVGTYEGLRQTVYLDPVGIPTVCFGSTKGLTKEMVGKVTLTRAECDALLVEELIHHRDGMRGCLKNPDAIPAGTHDAFTSFTFNVGIGAFCSSTARRLLDQGQYQLACDELLRWVYARRAGVKIKLPGLVKRRTSEHLMCTTGLPA